MATSDCTATPNTCGNWCDMRCSSIISVRWTYGRCASLTIEGQYSWKLFATAESNQINRAKLNGNANCRKATVSELNVLLESPRLSNEVCVNDSSGNAMKKKTVSWQARRQKASSRLNDHAVNRKKETRACAGTFASKRSGRTCFSACHWWRISRAFPIPRTNTCGVRKKKNGSPI